MKALPDFESEMASTRRTLERVPSDKLSWKPHEKSGTLGWLAQHIATMPHWGAVTLTTTELSLDTLPPPQPTASTEELLATFDKNVAEFREQLEKVSDEDLNQRWICTWGGNTIIDAPRSEVLRVTVLNHIIHHRAQMTMYFRLLGVPVPGLYGPSADEMPGSAGGASA